MKHQQLYIFSILLFFWSMSAHANFFSTNVIGVEQFSSSDKLELSNVDKEDAEEFAEASGLSDSEVEDAKYFSDTRVSLSGIYGQFQIAPWKSLSIDFVGEIGLYRLQGASQKTKITGIMFPTLSLNVELGELVELTGGYQVGAASDVIITGENSLGIQRFIRTNGQFEGAHVTLGFSIPLSRRGDNAFKIYFLTKTGTLTINHEDLDALNTSYTGGGVSLKIGI